MIPKIIHYCWFGGGEKPSLIKKCIQTWKIHLSDYEIIEWNEENFDLNINEYVIEAYKLKKFAFVSDYVRIYALYHYGGIYLDTDVEVYKSFDNLLQHNSFWGFEQENYIATSTIGGMKNNQLIGEFLNIYKNMSFVKANGHFDNLTNVALITDFLEKKGLSRSGEYQEIENLGVFYPQKFFSPFDYINCRNFHSEETYTLHHFYKSWLPVRIRLKGFLKINIVKVIGGDNLARIRTKFINN